MRKNILQKIQQLRRRTLFAINRAFTNMITKRLALRLYFNTSNNVHGRKKLKITNTQN